MTRSLMTADSVHVLADLPPLRRELLSSLGLHGLHCGSGGNLLAGCLNVDRTPIVTRGGQRTAEGRLAMIDGELYYLQSDLTAPLPLMDGSVDWVYSEHFIEHVGVDQAVTWLAEVRRVLSAQGFVRLSTPDLRRYVAGYLDDADGFFAAHRDQLRTIGFPDVPDRRGWMVNQVFFNWGHQWIYDVDELRAVAVSAGFAADSLSECAFRQGGDPDVAALDSAARRDESFYAEIRR